jgi:SAM-dependent MidA family methyltransferase
MTALEDALKARIDSEGPISVADYMAASNAHYYATRDPLGAAGDFVTAPEISQMFGELCGIWLADLWQRAGRPDGASYVELGPGRGTLAADALKAMRAAGLAPSVHFVETSPVLRAAQADRVPDAHWHATIDSLPDTGPLLVMANEFFDALPVRQFDVEGRELRVAWEDGSFVRDGDAAREDSPESFAIVAAVSHLLARQGGAMLAIDYGHDRPGKGDTLQAVSRHSYADPWRSPGSVDLTAHVDFAALGHAGREAGARLFGPVTQGAWLEAMGIGLRAAALARNTPERGAEIVAARERLAAPDQMGRLFKAIALVAPSWPEPAGF